MRNGSIHSLIILGTLIIAFQGLSFGEGESINPLDISLEQYPSASPYTAGAPIEMRVVVRCSDWAQLTSVGVRLTIPPGWSYEGRRPITCDPAIENYSGDTLLEFAWITPPESDCEFAYSLLVPEGDTGAKYLSGQVAYRTTAKEFLSAPVITPLDAPMDTVPPVITLLGDNPVTMTVGQEFVDPGYTALDDIDGDITANVVVSGFVDSAVVDMYTLQYDVSDNSGNAAQTVSRTVNVVAAEQTEETTDSTTSSDDSTSTGTYYNNGNYSSGYRNSNRTNRGASSSSSKKNNANNRNRQNSASNPNAPGANANTAQAPAAGPGVPGGVVLPEIPADAAALAKKNAAELAQKLAAKGGKPSNPDDPTATSEADNAASASPIAGTQTKQTTAANGEPMETAATVLAARAGQSTPAAALPAGKELVTKPGLLDRLRQLSKRQLIFLGAIAVAVIAIFLMGFAGSRAVYTGPNRRRIATPKSNGNTKA